MPIARFQTPDGRIARFEVPEGTTPEQAQALMGNIDFSTLPDPNAVPAIPGTDMKGPGAPPGMTPPPSHAELDKLDAEGKPYPKPFGEEPGFIDRLTADFKKRGQMAQEIRQAQNLGQQTLPESLLQVTGKVVAGAGNDIIAEGLKSTGQGIAAITPDAIKEPVSLYAKSARDFVLNSDIGKAGLAALSQGMDAYKQFAQENPRAARNIESVVDIGMFLPPGKAAQPVTAASEAAGGVVSKMGTAIMDSADARTLARKTKFVQDLITPKDIPTVRADQFGRATEKGLLRSRVVAPSPQESAIIDAVSELPVSKNKSLLANRNIIEDALNQEAEGLKATLQANDVVFPRKEFAARLTGAIDNLSQNPLLTGDAAQTAEKIMAKYGQILQEQKSSASGLLEARKQLDRWVQSQKGAGVFDPAKENAISAAVREIRQATNDFVGEKVPAAGVKESLQKQSNFYRAIENITTKGAYEAPNAALRMAKKVTDSVPGKGAIAKAAVAAGVGGAGFLAPSVAIPAALTYGAGKLITSPGAQKGAGAVVNAAGRLLQGKNPLTMSDIMKMKPAEAREALKKLKTK